LKKAIALVNGACAKACAGLFILLAVSGCSSGANPESPAIPQSPASPQNPVTPPIPNALFQVGAAVVGIDPTAPVYVGGYSDPGKPAIQASNDPLQVRAFVVAKGTQAVAFAVVDSTGWFAEYQEQQAGYGQFGARVDAAAALASHGFTVDRSAVLVSTTHSHATPTLVGIWGQMGAANLAYVKQVHDAVVQAVDQAASNLHTSELWFANGNISSIIWQNGQGTDHVDGFKVDAQMPILWARDPATGATNALYVNIPNHPDEFRPFNGSTVQGFGADVPGAVRAALDASMSGVSVVASGTLGRQESPGQDSTYAEVAHQGDYVTNAVRLALTKAAPLTSDQLGGAEQLVQVSVGSTQYNLGLLQLMQANASNTPFGGPSCNPALKGMCSVPRAIAAPWCNGNCTLGASGSSTTTLSTYVTALRIGPLLYVSNPGESFAEVNDTIRADVQDALSVNAVGLAGDFLGYNWNPSDYTTLQFGSSDFAKYNVGPDLAQKTADGGYANAAALGFTVAASPVAVTAVSDTSVASLPGVQFYPSQLETAAPSINFYGSTAQPQGNYGSPDHLLSSISWDFGDQSTGQSASHDRFDHAFPGPGVYEVTATINDTVTGKSRSWTQTLTIDDPLEASITARQVNGKLNLGIYVAGGQGTLIAARWACPDGSTQYGLTTVCAMVSGTATVTAMDGAGNTVQASAKFKF
jgi:hypothetical protein